MLKRLIFCLGLFLGLSLNFALAQCLTISTTQVDVSCFGGNDGQITLTITPGTFPNAQPPYSIDLYYFQGGLTPLASHVGYMSNTITFTPGNTSLNLPGADAQGIVATQPGDFYRIDVRSTGGSIICRNKSLLGIQVFEPSIFTASTTQTNVSCFGSNDGTITVTPSGGIAPYDFSIDGGATYPVLNVASHTFTALTAGLKNIRVRDANTCETAIIPVTLTEPLAAVSAATSQTNVTCFGGNNGTITVTPAGGTAPYDFSIDGGATYPVLDLANHTFTTLTTGLKNIRVRDANNCQTVVIPVTITQPAVALSAATSQTNVSCFGGNDGTITVTPAGGTAPYDFSIDGGTTYSVLDVANHTFTSLTAGLKNIRVRDANNCETAVIPLTITQPIVFTASTTQINVSCFGGNDGTITVTPSGGISPYDFSIDGGATYPVLNVASHTFTTLTVGLKNIRVRDANACETVIIPVTITQPVVLTAATSQTNVSCFGGNNGTITVTPAGGTAPYDFSIDGGATYPVLDLAIHTFITLTAGLKNIQVRDAHNCQTAVIPVTITQPAVALSAAPSQTNVSCFGGNNGTITVTPAGGTAPYDFSIDGGATYPVLDVANHTFTTLTAGLQSIRVRDANNCETVIIPVTITQPAALTAPTSQTNVSCFGGNNGTITVTPAGGTAPYDFSIDGGSTYPVLDVANHTFTTLTVGLKNIRVRDANNCETAIIPVTITQPAVLTAPTSQTNISCFGGNDGTITVTPAGGVAPYDFSINGGTTYAVLDVANHTFTALTAGLKNIRVRDANNCETLVIPVVVTEPTLLTAPTSKINVSCFGGNDGSVTITPVGGTPPYDFSIDGGATYPALDIATHTFPTLTASVVNVRVRDANSCETSIIPVTITQPVSALILSNSGNVSLACFADTNGSGTFTASGGTSLYSFTTLSNTTGGTVSTTPTTAMLSNAGAGSVTIQVTDINNCVATNTITITQPTVLTLATSVTNVLCFGGSTGAIDLTVNGGTSPYGFVWSNAATTEDIIGLNANTYNVTVTDANGCTANTSAMITEPVSAVSFGTTLVNVTCFGGSDGSITVTAAGGTGLYEFSSNSGGSFTGGVNPFIFTNLSAGPYSIVVRDANLCSSMVSTVTLTSNPIINFVATPTAATCLGINDGKIDITMEAGGAGGPFTYSNDGGLNFGLSPNFTSLAPGSYDIVIQDVMGCFSAVASTVVGSVTSINITAVTPTDASCIGIDDGSIDVQVVTGGTGTYTYSLDGGAFSGSPIFTLLAVASYSVVAMDGNGCTSSPQSVVVGSAISIVPTISSTDAACFNNNGSITINSVVGGTTPLQYSIDNGLNFQLSNTFNNLAPNISPATYKVLVKDGNSCLSPTTDILISQPVSCVVGNCGVFNVTATNVRPTCANKNDGTITLDVSGGTSPYVVTLSKLIAGVPSAPQALPGPGPTFTFVNLSPDDYQYSVQDAAANLCALPYTLLLQESVQAVASNFVDAKCFNEPVGEATLTVTSGGTSPFAYSIDNGSSWTAFTSPANITNLPPSASPYNILVADDNAGLCSSQVMVTINNASSQRLDTLYVNRTISLPDLATGTMLIGVEESAQEPYEVKLELIKPLFPSQGFSLDWTPIVRNPLNLKFEYDARNLFAGDYQLSIRDNLGCEKSYVITIKVDTNIAIPNIFTPNGDGVNDIFFIRNLPVETNVLITNRWGKEVFKAGDYQNDWGGGDISDGVYYYRITASGQVFTGWLEIQRGQ